jgi:hypothetical protein
MTMLGRIAVIGLCVVIAGCSSVPLGTMWKLSRMGPEAILEANPVEVRAAVRSHRGLLDVEGFATGALHVGVQSEVLGDRDWRFELDDVSTVDALRLERPPPDERWRVYRIAAEQLSEFQSMQQELTTLVPQFETVEGEHALSFWVSFPRESWLEGIDSLSDGQSGDFDMEIAYRVDIQFDAADGFFTLLREDEFDLSWILEYGNDSV